jgi:hypothetical protein
MDIGNVILYVLGAAAVIGIGAALFFEKMRTKNNK